MSTQAASIEEGRLPAPKQHECCNATGAGAANDGLLAGLDNVNRDGVNRCVGAPEEEFELDERSPHRFRPMPHATDSAGRGRDRDGKERCMGRIGTNANARNKMDPG